MNTIEHRVRERAYYIWEDEGRLSGRSVAHWIQAEAELTQDAEAHAEVVALPATETAAAQPKAKPAARAKAVSSPIVEGKAAAKKAPAKKVAAAKAPVKKAVGKAPVGAVALH